MMGFENLILPKMTRLISSYENKMREIRLK